MAAPRILLLHDHRPLVRDVGRACLFHDASLHVATSQSELIEVLAGSTNPHDLVIAKDVISDWFTVAAALLACRAFGLRTPFILVGDPADKWNKVAVATAGSAWIIDDRSSRWLIPRVLREWFERYHAHRRRDAA